MMDLKLNTFEENNSEYSCEESLMDVIDIQDELIDMDKIIHGFENCEFVLDQINKYGITDTIKDMIGDQITYNSKEELVIGLEAILTKLLDKTFANISPFNSHTREFETNPKDTIMRFSRFVSKVIDELNTIKDDEFAIPGTLCFKIQEAAKNLMSMISNNNLNNVANGRSNINLHKTDGFSNRPISAEDVQRVLKMVPREVLDPLSKWMGSEKVRRIKDSLSNNTAGISAQGQGNLGRLIISAKKQFQIIVKCVMAIYSSVKRHKMRRNAKARHDVKLF